MRLRARFSPNAAASPAASKLAPPPMSRTRDGVAGFQGRTEGRAGGDVNPPTTTEHVALKGLRGQGLTIQRVLDGRKDNIGDARIGDVAQLKIEQRAVDVKRAEHLQHAQWRVRPADRLSPPGLDRRRRARSPINGHQDQKRLLRPAHSLNQSDRASQPGFSAVHRRNGGLPPVCFGRDVKPDRRTVALDRLNVTDDVALPIMRRELPDGEIGPIILSRRFKKGGLSLLGHALDETETARAGKLGMTSRVRL